LADFLNGDDAENFKPRVSAAGDGREERGFAVVAKPMESTSPYGSSAQYA